MIGVRDQSGYDAAGAVLPESYIVIKKMCVCFN